MNVVKNIIGEKEYCKVYEVSDRKGKKVYVYKPVSTRIMEGYAGMNPEAAKVFHFTPKPKPNEILIDRTLKGEWKIRTIKHELIEKGLMDKGWPYWKAHEYADRHEQDRWDKLKIKKPKIEKGI